LGFLAPCAASWPTKKKGKTVETRSREGREVGARVCTLLNWPLRSLHHFFSGGGQDTTKIDSTLKPRVSQLTRERRRRRKGGNGESRKRATWFSRTKQTYKQTKQLVNNKWSGKQHLLIFNYARVEPQVESRWLRLLLREGERRGGDPNKIHLLLTFNGVLEGDPLWSVAKYVLMAEESCTDKG